MLKKRDQKDFITPNMERWKWVLRVQEIREIQEVQEVQEVQEIQEIQETHEIHETRETHLLFPTVVNSPPPSP